MINKATYASGGFARMAAYVHRFFEGQSEEQAIESRHFECRQPASRGLNRAYDLGELMSRVVVP